MLARFLASLDRHRLATQGVLLAALIVAGVLVLRLKVLDSPERWMPAATLDDWRVFEKHFDAGDNVGVGLHFTRPISEEDARRVGELRQKLQDIAGVYRVYDCTLVAEKIERVPVATLIEPYRELEQAALAWHAEPTAATRAALLEAARGAVAHADKFELYNGALWDSFKPDETTRRLRDQARRLASMPLAGSNDSPADETELAFFAAAREFAELRNATAAGRGLGEYADAYDRTLMIVCELAYEPGESANNPDTLNERRRFVTAEIERIVEEQRGDPAWQGNVRFHVAGGIVMMAELEKRTRQVAWRFLPLSLLLGLVTLLVGFRSWRALLVAVCGSFVAMLLVLGWQAAADGTLGVVTMATPALISVIATASTIHFASYAAERGTTGERGVRARLVLWVCVPCLGAAATTAVGFLMLAFNELAPVRDLGINMFVGAMLAFFGVFVVSQLLPIRAAHRGTWITPARMREYARWATFRPRLLVWSSLALMAVLTYFAWPRPEAERFGLYVDADPFSFFSKEQPIKQALNHFSERDFAVYQLEVVLVPKNPGTPARELAPPDEQYLSNQAAAAAFADQVSARRDLGVIRVLSTLAYRQRYQEFLSEMNRRASDVGLFAAFLQFGQYATSANILSHSFTAWTTDKRNKGALRFTFVVLDTKLGFRPLVDFVRQNLPEDQFHCYVAGSVAQTVDLHEGLGAGMLYGLGSSLLVFGALCMFLFRSLRLSLIAYVPNVFPVLLIFGIMGLFKVPISSGSAMVASIAIGIALNDTIHFLLHYRRLTRIRGVPVERAARECVQQVGRPIVLTSLVLVAGFAIFLWTDFVPLFHFGLLSSIAMLAALVGDLLLLPNLLIVFDKVPAPRSVHRWESYSPAAEQAAVK